jgi:hypothetical protein
MDRGAPCFGDLRSAFLGEFEAWLRGGEQSGVAWLVAEIKGWAERCAVALPATSRGIAAFRGLRDWAALTEDHLKERKQWAEAERERAGAPEPLVDLIAGEALPELEALQSWASRTSTLVQRVSIDVAFSASEDCEPAPLTPAQRSFAVWAGSMTRHMQDLADIVVGHQACCEETKAAREVSVDLERSETTPAQPNRAAQGKAQLGAAQKSPRLIEPHNFTPNSTATAWQAPPTR